MVTEARLFEYPERFVSPFSGAPFAPYPRYTISVRSGARRHTIVWEVQGAGSDEARRLSMFILQLNAMLRTEPAIRALPPGFPCA